MIRQIIPTVNFNLDKPTSDKPTIIYLTLVNNGARFKYSTGFKVLPKFWDISRQRIRNKIEATNNNSINFALSELSKETTRILTDYRTNRKELSNDELKNHLNIFTGKNKNVTELFEFIDLYITKSVERIDKMTGRRISSETIRKYNYAKNCLLEFQQHYNKKIGFDTLNIQFFESWITYMTITKNYNTNNIDKIVETLRTFCNAATEKGLNSNMEYKKFKVRTEKTETVYLTKDEILKIYNFNFSDNSRLDRARDLFIIGCYTGLRYSDFTDIHPENIQDDFLIIHQAKTGDEVTIPLNETVKKIFSKYGNKPPETISNVRLNLYIKEVCELAGVTDIVEIQKTQGGKRVKTLFRKCDLVTCHTARRSFATNLYADGVQSRSIMKVTGHRTERAFLAYIKLDGKGHAEQLLKSLNT